MADLINFLCEQKEKRRIRISKRYTTALLCGKIRLWGIPVRIRRGELCRTFCIYACRHAREFGKGKVRYLEDLNFLKEELAVTQRVDQRQHLQEALGTMLLYARDFN